LAAAADSFLQPLERKGREDRKLKIALSTMRRYNENNILLRQKQEEPKQ
jgi:hypothetical protein